jgi:uncharacterized membrane protein
MKVTSVVRIRIVDMVTRSITIMNMRKKVLSSCILVLFAILVWIKPLSAHEKHKKPEQDKANQSAPVRPTPEQQTVPGSTNAAEDSESPAGVRPVPMPFSGPIQDHAHNKIVHLPIGLGLAGVLFAFIAMKKPEMLMGVRILWLLAALAGVGAYFTGQEQEEPFEGGELHDVVELHENLGIGTSIVLGLGFLFSLSRRLKGLTAGWAVVVLGMILVTGYYGGILAHS